MKPAYGSRDSVILYNSVRRCYYEEPSKLFVTLRRGNGEVTSVGT